MIKTSLVSSEKFLRYKNLEPTFCFIAKFQINLDVSISYPTWSTLLCESVMKKATFI